jgi:hypothetical protein
MSENAVVLYCPFCGLLFLFDSSSVTIGNKQTFETDRQCSICTDVNLLHANLRPGSWGNPAAATVCAFS